MPFPEFEDSAVKKGIFLCTPYPIHVGPVACKHFRRSSLHCLSLEIINGNLNPALTNLLQYFSVSKVPRIRRKALIICHAMSHLHRPPTLTPVKGEGIFIKQHEINSLIEQ